MENKALEDIKAFAIARLQSEYGYCGVADAPEIAMLNSGGETENIVISIKYETDAI